MISVSETGMKRFPSSRRATLDSLSNSLPNLNRRDEAAKLQRPAARSMRTIRSKFVERTTGSEITTETTLSSAVIEGNPLQRNFSDEEDSRSTRISSEDLCLTFSDCSAYSSDISGELYRLATATSSPVYNRSEDGPNRCFREVSLIKRLGKSRQYEENVGCSERAPETGTETLEEEELELFVKLLVHDLGEGRPIESQKKAATELRFLAKNNMRNREVIAKAGAIWPLVCLLRSADPSAQEAAVTALLNLSLCDENKMEITRAGAIKPIIHVLKCGTAVAKQNAACALLNLSLIDDNKFSIGAAGAIPPLVSLLVNGTSRGKKDAATTLYSLSCVHQNKERVIRAGAVRPLVDLMADPSAGMVDKAAVILSNLANVPDGKNAIVHEGGIPVLVEVIEEGSHKGKEYATVALLRICEDSFLYRTLVSREGAIPPLVALSQMGNSRIRKKAALLLQYLRETRQAGVIGYTED
eukprot:TRINITY_DN2748_c0_g2_i1.p1 TRINITY_DN2748_c0_g2~~TRINITY_DN2748_c0_g2_i1.p1  ORF type:complete len:471 (-),score=51.01 TRINITY_DN2748_c0_g2_i1:437-1849(-)